MTVDSTRAEAGKSGFFQSCNVAQLAQLTMKRVDSYIRAGLPARTSRATGPQPAIVRAPHPARARGP